jgi:hypothetical protein
VKYPLEVLGADDRSRRTGRISSLRTNKRRAPYPKWALIRIALLESLGEAVVMAYRTEPGWKTGRTKGARDLRDGGAERLALEGKDLLRSLRSCRGFTVDFGDGRVGRVVEVRLGLLSGEPRALLVETGVFRRRRVEVPFVDVASVVPSRRHLVLWYPGIMGVAGQGRELPSPLGEAGER